MTEQSTAPDIVERPEDIPEDVWSAARACFEFNPSPEAVTTIARAILAEREHQATTITTLRSERDALERNLRTVQNAAKCIAAAHGTELEHLRQNRTFDHKLRAEHESLLERDAAMTEALTAAEARAEAAHATIKGLESALAEAVRAKTEFRAKYLDLRGAALSESPRQ